MKLQKTFNQYTRVISKKGNLKFTSKIFIFHKSNFNILHTFIRKKTLNQAS